MSREYAPNNAEIHALMSFVWMAGKMGQQIDFGRVSEAITHCLKTTD